MDYQELQGLYTEKFQEGNSGPNADTGKKPQRNGKGYKKNAQFQNFFGNIFLHSFIFSHECCPNQALTMTLLMKERADLPLKVTGGKEKKEA